MEKKPILRKPIYTNSEKIITQSGKSCGYNYVRHMYDICKTYYILMSQDSILLYTYNTLAKGRDTLPYV